jgi:hypothetical protein
VYGIDRGMTAATEQGPTTTTTSIERITKTTSATDPWMLFLYALKAPATKEKYVQRLIKFLDFLGYPGTKEEKARAFAAQAKGDPIYAFNSVLKFFQSKREQIDRKEFLRYYSQVFDFVVIDSSFYRPPNLFMTKRWASLTPDDFRFTAKFPRSITHGKKDLLILKDNFATSLMSCVHYVERFWHYYCSCHHH